MTDPRKDYLRAQPVVQEIEADAVRAFAEWRVKCDVIGIVAASMNAPSHPPLMKFAVDRYLAELAAKPGTDAKEEEG